MTEQNNDHGLDMDFLSEEVLAELDKALDPSLVKSYEGPGGKRLSYIETHTAISNANRIFKPANWGPRVLEGPTLHHINITVPGTGEIKEVHEYYTARVAIYVYGRFISSDEGFGEVDTINEGTQSKMMLGMHEKARKGAISDGIKRALRVLGKQFGNSLYGGDSRGDSSAASGPACPKHGAGSHVRPSKRGDGYFCAHKDTSTESGYCDYTPREESETPSTRETASYAGGGGGYGADGYDESYPGADDDWPSDARASGPTREQLLNEYISLGAKHNAPCEQLYKSFEKKYGRSLDDATYEELTQLVEQGRKVGTREA